MRKIPISARQQPDSLTLVAALLVLSACSPPQEDIRIEFGARLLGAPAMCSDSAEPGLSDLRFYVSEPMLVNDQGQPVAIELFRDDAWQQADLAMIDLEDGSGRCENGTAETNAWLSGTVPRGDYRGLTFTVGVPFARNHADPLSAAAPLDDSTMHWHWRSGYKFLRAGVAGGNDELWIHIGSSACEGKVQSITSCKNPNRIDVDLPDYVPGAGVAVDLTPLFDASDLDDGQTENCSSGPAEVTCAALFELLGLPFGETGTRQSQQIFRVDHP